MNVDVSVIVPVYNAESTIMECYESIAEQSLKGLEIIFVDDGSTDNSRYILKQIDSQDPRVTLICQDNSGPAVARNVAIERAKGNFVFFVDSDDLLFSEDVIDTMLSVAISNSSEIVCGMLQSFNANKVWVPESLRQFSSLRMYNCGVKHFPSLIQHVSPCGKLYSRELILSKGIKFLQNCNFGEDTFFVMSLFKHTDKISLLPNVVYRYRASENSLTSTVRLDLFTDLLRVTKGLNKEFSNLDAEQKEVKVKRDIHFTRSFIFHFSKAIDSEENSDFFDRLLVLSIEFFSEVCMEATDVFSPRNQLLISLIKNSDLDNLKVLISEGLNHALIRNIEHQYSNLDAEVMTSLYRFEKSKKKASSTYSDLTKKAVFSKVNYNRVFWSLKTYAASLVSPFIAKIFPKIWLVGERQGLGIQDTGFLFFKWACDSKIEEQVYFVTKKEYKDSINPSYRNRVLTYGSFRHFLYFFASKLIAYSDSPRDVFYHWPRLATMNKLPKSKRVFLQHGVIGLHRMEGYYDYKNMVNRHSVADLFIVSSEKEKGLVIDRLGHPPESVKYTGLSRFDSLFLENKSTKNREILYVPTWRSWLRWNSLKTFEASEFYKNIANWLCSEDIQKMLEDNDLTLKVMIHHAFMKFEKQFKSLESSNIKVIDMNTCNVQKQLIEADLLVTDYSSVSFDFLFLGKPVLFYQFDLGRFLSSKGGSLIDFDADLPGPSFSDPGKLTAKLHEIAKNGFVIDEVYESRAKKMLPTRDGMNSSRIYEAIHEL